MKLMTREVRFAGNYVALFLLLYIFVPSLFLSVEFIFQTVDLRLTYWLSCGLLALLFAGLWLKRRVGVVELAATLAVLALSHYLTYSFFDTYHDSLAYIQPGINQIMAGFNPVYDGLMDLGRQEDLWITVASYYPKVLSYFGAAAYAAIGDLELCKVPNLVLLFSSLFFVGHYARHSRRELLLWLLACLNPVIFYQALTWVLDGAIAALCTVAVFYAYLYFSGRKPDRLTEIYVVIAMSLLCCVRATGIAYAGIVLVCLSLWRWRRGYCERNGGGRLLRSFADAFRFGLRRGIFVLLLTALLGFHPYLSNVFAGRHVFYPLFTSYSSNADNNLDIAGHILYPNADNRFSRLVLSIFSVPTVSPWQPTELGLAVSAADWDIYGRSGHLRAAALGPLFSVLLLLSLAALICKRGKTDGWLLLTLFLLTAVQPYAYETRYAPYVWIFPFVLLLPPTVPSGKWYRSILYLSVLAAVVNLGGIAYSLWSVQSYFTAAYRWMLDPHRGQTVCLDRSIFDYSGLFKRFALRQKYVNPEDTDFYRLANIWPLRSFERNGFVYLFFEDALTPLSELAKEPLSFNGDPSHFLDASEGMFSFADYYAESPRKIVRSAGEKVKFFLRVTERPEVDWSLTLKGVPHDLNHRKLDNLKVFVMVNNKYLDTWQADHEGGAVKTVVIPQKLLEESFNDELHLMTITLRLPAAQHLNIGSSRAETGDSEFPIGLQLDGLEFRPASSGDVI